MLKRGRFWLQADPKATREDHRLGIVAFCAKILGVRSLLLPNPSSPHDSRLAGGASWQLWHPRFLAVRIHANRYGYKQVAKLRNAMHEYENDRWRIIASKVGSGFSPAACREKAQELDAIERGEGGSAVEEEGEESGFGQSELGGGGSDPTASFQ
jgi:hypothetical protein